MTLIEAVRLLRPDRPPTRGIVEYGPPPGAR